MTLCTGLVCLDRTLLSFIAHRHAVLFMLSSYSAEAHKILEAAGYAPAILSHKVLPGRWHMVVMDFMEGSSTWDEVTNKPVVKLRTAVDLLHEADFVHGDLRPPNVLVDKEKVSFDQSDSGLCTARF